MKKHAYWIAASVVVAVGAFSFFHFLRNGDNSAEAGSDAPVSSSRRIKVSEARAKRENPNRRFRKGRSSTAERISVRGGVRPPEKPDFTLDAEDEAKLTAEMRQLYRDIQSALDDNKQQKVIALVQRLQSLKEWPDGIPTSVKLRALEALSWFGAPGMAEAVSFLGDADPEVVESAVDKFSTMLNESELGDRAVAEILKQIVQVVHDHEALDTFLTEMNNMRNSVRADMAAAIFDSGNQDAIAVLDENIDFLFCDNEGDYEVKTRADLEQYVIDNPDGEDDEDFYGPPKADE